MTGDRLFNGKPFKRTHRLTRDVPMTPLEKLGDALERCIVGCQGRRNAERAQAVLDVIKEQGWAVVPRDAPIFAFLFGSGPLDGQWFGDRHPTERGAFWWRKHLRAALIPPKEEK